MDDSDLIVRMGLGKYGQAKFRALVPRENQHVHPKYQFGDMQPFDIGLYLFSHFLDSFLTAFTFC